MRQRATAVAGLAATLLLTTACAGDDGDDDIAGVDEATQEPTEDNDDGATDNSPDDDSGSEDNTTNRPDVELPDDMNNVFEDTETGDPTQDEIIADVVERINAIDLAFAESDPDHHAVSFYSIENALVSSKEFIANSAEEDLSWGGTSTYYDFSVENDGRHSTEPIVRYCNDIRELYTKELDTGDLRDKSDGAAEFLATQLVVRQDDSGVWQVFQVLPPSEEEDEACER